MNKFIVKQRGVSLIELILSLAMGLILLLTLASVYVTSNNTNKLREANAELDETARQVFDRLKQDLDLAGYVDAITPNASGDRAASELANLSDSEIQNMYGRIIGAGSQPVSPIERVSGGDKAVEFVDDELKIRYQAMGALDDNTGWGRDCISANSRDANNIITDSYKFDSASGTLSCNDEPIVGGGSSDATSISELTFRYLITQPPQSAEATLYNSQAGLYVTNIVDAAGVVGASSPLGWNGVIGVEVCMVVAGAPLKGRLSAVADQQGNIPTCVRTATGSLGTDIDRTSGDQRLYRRYIKIFNIPNALYFTP